MVKDQNGNPMSGVAVAFAVTSGGGSTGQASVQTNSSGIATADGWILGTVSGQQTLTASVANLPPVTFTATAAAGPAASFAISGGDNQSAVVGTAVPVAPAVIVKDSYGNPKPGVTIAFSTGGGGGSITGASAVTNNEGVATIGGWTLGTVAGANTIVADLPPLGSLVFTAFGQAGAAASVSKLAGDNQVGTPGELLALQPTVVVKDTYGNAKEGAAVTFTVTSGGGTVAAASVVTNSSGVAAGTWTLGPATGANTLSATVSGITPVSFTATASTINFTIDGLNLTQSVQTFGGTVPLISGKSAYLRVFGRASQSTTLRPIVRVTVRNGSSTTVYDLSAPASVPTAVTQGQLNSSWNVVLPGSAVLPGSTITAAIDPLGAVPETSESDNQFPQSGVPISLDVRSPGPIRATFVPVLQIPNGRTGDVSAGNVSSYVSDALAMFPVASIDAAVHATYSFSGDIPTSYDSVWSRLLSEMSALRAAEGSARNYYGVIKTAANFGGTGIGYVGLGAAVGVDWPSWRSKTVAHEWGHNFGRLHANCGNPANPDPNYPYANASVGAYGIDVQAQSLKAPGAVFDLMSYCEPAWISDYTYLAIMSYRTGALLTESAPKAERSLLVWGRMTGNEIVLEAGSEVTGKAAALPPTGPYRVQGRDENGRPVFDIPFDVTKVPELPSTGHFAFLVPIRWKALESMTLIARGQTIRRSATKSVQTQGGLELPGTALVDRRGGIRVQWDEKRYPLAVVRDRNTGEILAFARGGNARIAGPSTRSLQILLSNGTHSVNAVVRE